MGSFWPSFFDLDLRVLELSIRKLEATKDMKVRRKQEETSMGSPRETIEESSMERTLRGRGYLLIRRKDSLVLRMMRWTELA